MTLRHTSNIINKTFFIRFFFLRSVDSLTTGLRSGTEHMSMARLLRFFRFDEKTFINSHIQENFFYTVFLCIML